MKGCLRWLGIVVVTLLFLTLIVPLAIPYPAAPDAVTPEVLADPDGEFTDVNGLNVYLRDDGRSAEALILLHGLGSSTVSWDDVAGTLAKAYRVIALDRPGFGLTARPMPGEWAGENPYSQTAQADMIVALMDQLRVQQAVLVGHSAGGTIAAITALRHPERVKALVFVDAAIYQGGGAPAWVRPLLGTPQMRRLGPWIVRYIFGSRGDQIIRSAWYDPGKITSERLAAYRRPLQLANWERAFWEVTLASQSLDIASRLDRLTMPALVITGDKDTWVATDLSRRLAEDLPRAQLAVIPQCGHVPQEEQPAAFLQAIMPFLEELPQ
jgi:pimeloyl-ACP methyl ester carboxylesterase